MAMLLLMFSSSAANTNSDNGGVEIDSFPRYAAKQLAIANDLKNTDLKEALVVTGALLQKSLPYENDSITNSIKYRHSLYLLMINENMSSKNMIQEILPYYHENNMRRWITLRIRLASLEVRFGNYVEAIEYLEDAIPKCDKHKLKINKGLAYSYLSDIYRLKSDFGQAFKYADLAYQLFTKLKTYRLDFCLFEHAWLHLHLGKRLR